MKHSLDYDRKGRRVPGANAIRKRAEDSSTRVLACTRCPDVKMVYFADALRHNRIVHNFEENICACVLCDFAVFQVCNV